MTVNERACEEWVEDTTPCERVRNIMRRTYESQSAAEIAERAMVSTEEARELLDAFAGEFVETVGSRGYRRAFDSIIRERAEQILDDVDVETLERRVEELRATVREYEVRAGTESPQDAELDEEENTEWVTARRNLRIAEAALEFAEERNVG